MHPPHAKIVTNLIRVRDRIARAAEQAGRLASDIRLVGVTKYVDISTAAELFAAGCADLGESRPQELWHKAADPRLSQAHWHLVGHLQRNKVPRTLPLVALIHSVDNERLLSAIDERAAAEGLTVDVLLEINCSGDVAKHGLSESGARALVEQLDRYPHVRVRGLMTMARLQGGRAAARQDFATLRRLRGDLQSHCPFGTSLHELSMGMSGDLEEAVAEGATIVRVGTALFE
jgi:pyridoxal phosphate enzyme (YggS family)